MNGRRGGLGTQGGPLPAQYTELAHQNGHIYTHL